MPFAVIPDNVNICDFAPIAQNNTAEGRTQPHAVILPYAGRGSLIYCPNGNSFELSFAVPGVLPEATVRLIDWKTSAAHGVGRSVLRQRLSGPEGAFQDIATYWGSGLTGLIVACSDQLLANITLPGIGQPSFTMAGDQATVYQRLVGPDCATVLWGVNIKNEPIIGKRKEMQRLYSKALNGISRNFHTGLPTVSPIDFWRGEERLTKRLNAPWVNYDFMTQLLQKAAEPCEIMLPA